ncbi:tyrosine-type recombinase/integrase [Desulfofundulus thermocisternus]|uniref:tyrosine-type recombinase/integrase n=1 Tax=Desulfofundulus thermocisternus TaxID=42471 RepID=UPI00217DA9F0|nr:site-specific integrase [Desulfofundulus thermocisternus]MCS5695264.1 tyrosine-type recombinase/integrase [Desulfofundulus thermocisternus]
MARRKKKADIPVKTRPETWQEALEEFLLLKRAQGRAERTLKDYVYYVNQFFNRYPNIWPDVSLMKKAVYDYLSQENISNSAFNLRRANLNSFFNFCVQEEILPSNPINGIQRKKDSGRIIHIDDDYIRKLLKLPDQTTYSGLRDYCFLLLTLDTGIRPSEAYQLKVSDFDFKLKQVTIQQNISKTRTQRILPLSQVTVSAFKKLFAARPADWKDDAPALCTNQGTPLNNKTWRLRLASYVKELGIHITPYSLRHVFALGFLRNEGNVFALQKMLGHTTLDMSKRYVALSGRDLQEQHEYASPLNTFLPKPKSRVQKIKKKKK